MSKVFYDHLIVLEEIEATISSAATTKEEKEELWKIVDELVHHRVLDSILTVLPREYHEDFMERFTQSPHDERLIIYLTEKSNKDVEKIIVEEISTLKKELLTEINKKSPRRQGR